MKFSTKIFNAVFFTTLVLGTAILVLAFGFVAKQNRDSFIARYSVFSTVLGDTLTRLDTGTESLMLNAAKVVAEKEKTKGILSTEELKKLTSQLNVTHLFVVDRQGKFIRSTNEDPSQIPNAFSFCPSYKSLYTNTNALEATPVVHPFPEPKPYKFLYIPSYDQQQLIEVGIRVDFVAKTLTEALGADSNLQSLSLYAPTGLALGQFKAKGVEFPGNTITLPEKFPTVVNTGEQLKIYTKVTSSHPQCCQCNVNHTSRNGEYYYILESTVSKNELHAIQASAKNIFVGLMFVNLILAIIFSRISSRRLVKNIELAVAKVQDIKKRGDITQRIRLPGNDELSYLTAEMDNMMDSLEGSQKKTIDAAKVQTQMLMAREVAHNMQSPAVAIELTLPFLVGISESQRKVLKNSAVEIKELAERLMRQSNLGEVELNAGANLISTSVAAIVENTIEGKKAEFSQQREINIELDIDEKVRSAALPIDPVELRGVLSNLVNNAAQSYSGKAGVVKVSLKAETDCLTLSVQDFGKGIPEDLLERLGKECLTSKPDGHGLGLLHMYRMVSSWNAEVAIDSKVGVGTRIEIRLPFTKVNKSRPFKSELRPQNSREAIIY